MDERRPQMAETTSLGTRIREFREDRGFTLAELAARADISRTYLWQLEGDKSCPSVDVLARIAQALDVRYSELMGEPPDATSETLVLPTLPSVPRFSDFSYSMLVTFQLCPMRFKRRYIDGDTEDAETFEWRLGLSLHNALKSFLHPFSVERTLPRLHRLLDEKWQSSGFDSAEHEAFWLAKAHKMLENFYHIEGALGHPIAVEESFAFSVGDFRIHGRIDRIDKVGANKYEVIDYKVLGTPIDEQEVQYNLQSVCLYFGAQSVLLSPPARITYFYLDAGVKVSFEPDQELMERRLSIIRGLVQQIRGATSFPATRNQLCFDCPLDGHCPATRLRGESTDSGT